MLRDICPDDLYLYNIPFQLNLQPFSSTYIFDLLVLLE